MITKNILFIEPFYKGSHKYFLDHLKKHSKHKITIQTKNGVFWKWKFLESALVNPISGDDHFDVVVGSNMLNLAPWIGVNRDTLGDAKLALYFHENQLTYPQNENDKSRNEFFGFQNLTSCFCADHVLFNSNYHLKAFLEAGKNLSKKLPDNIPVEFFTNLEKKSKVLPVGLRLKELDDREVISQNEIPLVLWNHRWEFDKNPELFLNTLIELKEEGVNFKLAMLGSSPKKQLPIFTKAKQSLEENIIQWGRVESFEEYRELLWRADILPVTSNHDFFGISVLEAIYCKTTPLLPNRCAYPDHFSLEEFSDIYYHNDEEFKIRLREQLLSKRAPIQRLEKLRAVVSNYSWSRVATHFDKLINEI